MAHKFFHFEYLISNRMQFVCRFDVVGDIFCCPFARMCREGALITLFTYCFFFHVAYASIHNTINEFVNIYSVGLNQNQPSMTVERIHIFHIHYDSIRLLLLFILFFLRRAQRTVRVKYANDECTRVFAFGAKWKIIYNAHSSCSRRWQSHRWH